MMFRYPLYNKNLGLAGTFVPVCDETVRRRHEDREVGDALNKHTEAALAFKDCVVSLLLVANITDDLAEANQFSVRPSQGL
jgi:hypothetical protein